MAFAIFSMCTECVRVMLQFVQINDPGSLRFKRSHCFLPMFCTCVEFSLKYIHVCGCFCNVFFLLLLPIAVPVIVSRQLTLYLVKPRILGMAKYSYYKKIHRKSIVRFFAKVNILKHAQMIALSRELKTDAF